MSYKQSIKIHSDSIVIKIIESAQAYMISLHEDRIQIPEKGKSYMFLINEYVGPGNGGNDIDYFITDNEDVIENGVGGNSNPNIKRFHGWRGTTNDIATYAYGVRKCEYVTIKKYKNTVHTTIKFGKDTTIDFE